MKFLKFLHGEAAAVVGEFLVIAEMHLGIESTLRRAGARVFADAEKEASRVNSLLKASGCRKVLFLGDLKHSILGFEEREKQLVADFVSRLDAHEVALVKGNHDGAIEGIPGLTVFPAEGTVITEGRNEYGVAHGHAWPSKKVLACPTMLLGHTHPSVLFVDANGARKVEKVWLVGETKVKKGDPVAKERGVRSGTRVIVFPAFNLLAGGIPVNALGPTHLLLKDGRFKGDKVYPGLIGPLFENKLFDLGNAQAYTLDGVGIGSVASLR